MSVFVVAEIGINHNGDLGIAEKLIDMAVFAGCDAVKFQKRSLDIVYTQELLNSSRESPWGTTQRAQKEALEFGKQQYDVIDRYCKQKGIEWFASAWDIESQKFLRQYNLKYNKIASAMLTYEPLLQCVAKEGKHTFISTGMSSFEEIDRAVAIFREATCPFELMHTVSTYPADPSKINLRCILMLKQRYGCPVGYSGHEVPAYAVSLGAVAMGATSIERHITLDRAMYGSDQAASLEAMGLLSLVRSVRTLEKALGDGQKRVLEEEIPIRRKLRWFDGAKPYEGRASIATGSVFSPRNVTHSNQPKEKKYV